jgi:hypothetical protein
VRTLSIPHPEHGGPVRVTFTADYSRPDPLVGWRGGWIVDEVLEAVDATTGEALDPAAVWIVDAIDERI